MSKTVAYLAQTHRSVSIDEQRAWLHPDDHVVLSGRQSFEKLTEQLARHGVNLRHGDKVKIHDLSCIPLSTTTLIRAMVKMLRAGISIEIVSAGIVLDPSAGDSLPVLLHALDSHSRHFHGIKTHPSTKAPIGRRQMLHPEQLANILAKLDQPGATATNVAKELGVARSTLFNFLRRYDASRWDARSQKVE